MVVYQCEDSLEGIFTAIYNTYEDRRKREDCRISLTQDLMLFAEYVPVAADDAKAQKVIRTLHQRFGREDYQTIAFALSVPDAEKAQAVYLTVADGLAEKCRPGHLFDYLAKPHVHQAFSLARGAAREYDHLRGFLRFVELEKGILYAEAAPKNHLLAFLMEHFADRFPVENFMIYDKGRKLLGIHPAGGGGMGGVAVCGGGAHLATEDGGGGSSADLPPAALWSGWFFMQCDDDPKEAFAFALSRHEMEYQELFRHFCHTITIRERRNAGLQRQMLPLRFREYMTEFWNERSDRANK